MMQNTKFNESLIRSGLTMYELSKLSGIPYTTINEIHRGKKDINQCATATVYRIAAVLGESTDDIINDIKYLDDVKGRYKGIDYIWHTDETSYIEFE